MSKPYWIHGPICDYLVCDECLAGIIAGPNGRQLGLARWVVDEGAVDGGTVGGLSQGQLEYTGARKNARRGSSADGAPCDVLTAGHAAPLH